MTVSAFRQLLARRSNMNQRLSGRGLLAAGAVVLIAVTSVTAQGQKPSFAGRWTVVSAAAGQPSGDLFGGKDFTAAQDTKTLTIVRTVPAEAMKYPGAKAAFNLDGSESKNSTLINGQTVDMISTAKWDGSKLVIVTKHTAQGMAIEHTESWSLDQGGDLRVDWQRVQAGRPSSGVWTYKKG